jgi:hypothetical protein
MLRFLIPGARRPSDAEQRVFEYFAAEVCSVARRSGRGARLSVASGSSIDLGTTAGAEFACAARESAARDHVRRQEDPLALIERLGAMIDSGGRWSEPASSIDAGLHLVRAVAMSELLAREAATRFSGHAPTVARAQAALECLAEALAGRVETTAAAAVARAFPRFVRALAAARPRPPAHEAPPRAAAGATRRSRSSSPSTFRA